MTDDVPAFPDSFPPAGAWQVLLQWRVSSHDEAAAARVAAASFVRNYPDPTGEGLVFASARARVAITMGELLANGLHHGDPPVRAALLRGEGAWLLVVSDAAVQRPPTITQVIGGQTRGGLGLRFITSLATSAGWHTDQNGKHVWALIGDEAPQHLIHALRPARRSGGAAPRNPRHSHPETGPT